MRWWSPGVVVLAAVLVTAAPGQGQDEEPRGAPAAFDLATEEPAGLAVTVGLPLYAQPSVRALVVARVRFATELEVLERRGGWARVSYEGRQLWLLVDRQAARFRLAPRGVSDQQLAVARQCLDRQRTLDLGPFPLYTDLDDEELVADLARLGRQVGEGFADRYGVRPESAPAAIVLFARVEDYLACRRALGATNAPGDGYVEEGLALFPVRVAKRRYLRARLVQHMAFLLIAQALGPNLPDWLRDGLAYDLTYGRIARDGTFEPRHLQRKRIRDHGFSPTGMLLITEEYIAPRSALKRLLREWDEPRHPTVEGVLELESFGLLEDDRQATARSLCGFLIRYLLAGEESAGRLRAFLADVAAGDSAGGAAFLAALGTTPEALDTGIEAWLWKTARKLRVDVKARPPSPAPPLYPEARRTSVGGGSSFDAP